MNTSSRRPIVWGFLCVIGLIARVASAEGIEKLPTEPTERTQSDWLVTKPAAKAGVYRNGENEIVLSNGLIRRVFRVTPNAATSALDNLMTGEAMLRGVKPEAVISIDGKTYDVGGLKGQPDYAFLRREWLEKMTADAAALQFTGFEIGATAAPFPWKRVRPCADLPWPPPGVSLTLQFMAPKDSPLAKTSVALHYELYDGIPLLAKWITVRNEGEKEIRLDRFTNEVLAVVERESAVDERSRWRTPNIHVASDFSFRGMDPQTADRTTNWVADPQYETQVNYLKQTPCLLETRPPLGPDAPIKPGETFDSFRTFELFHDSDDRERNGLAVRRMYRTLAPWVTENPILMHVTRSDPPSVKKAIDQCAEVGFEMVIMSFGSGFNIESRDPAYRTRIKELVDYANAKGIELGGYSLLASRGDSGADNMVINPRTGKPDGAIFGVSPCLGSKWGQDYFDNLYSFISETGLNLLEHDGSYPGDVCAATTHPGHRGLDDSQWTQWRTIAKFYQWCRGRGVYLNVPDFYFLTGSSKVGMGYRETNWSLPRAQQLIHARQHIFDGTWEKTPSMGWMFVPLTEYQGGGAAATIEPLSEHLPDYEAHLANCFGSGVQACYRGPRLYDTDATKAIVKKWVDFYKMHRPILDSDLVHVRRADGRDWDGMLHVNPTLKERGLAVVFNPTDETIKRNLSLPLYYTGLNDAVRIRQEDGEAKTIKLDRRWNAEVPVEVKPHGMTWLVIEE